MGSVIISRGKSRSQGDAAEPRLPLALEEKGAGGTAAGDLPAGQLQQVRVLLPERQAT